MIRSRRTRLAQRQEGLAQAQAALADSIDALHGAARRVEEAKRITQRLRELRGANHFAESIRHAYGRPA